MYEYCSVLYRQKAVSKPLKNIHSSQERIFERRAPAWYGEGSFYEQ
jgi:hypothetical protein